MPSKEQARNNSQCRRPRQQNVQAHQRLFLIMRNADYPQVRKGKGKRLGGSAQKLQLTFIQNKSPADFADNEPSNGRPLREVEKTAMAIRLPLKQETPTLPKIIPSSTLLEHIATSRFFHQYLSPKRTFWRLDLDFTSTVIENATKRSILSEIVIALGILTLPTRSRASYLAARCRYTRALRFTNQALADPKQSRLDEVLMAVILLGLYEVSHNLIRSLHWVCFLAVTNSNDQTTPDDAHSITSWTAHLDGACNLLRTRGRNLLHHGVQYRMFSMLRTQIVCFASFPD